MDERKVQNRQPLFTGEAALPPNKSRLEESAPAERAILAAVLIDATQWDHLAGRVQPEDFAVEAHRMIFEAMSDLVENGLGIDPLTVRARLEERGLLDRVGGPAYLHCMDLDLPDLGRTGAHVEIVKDRSLRRRLGTLGAQLARVAFDGDQSGQEVLAELELCLLNVGSHGSGTRLDALGPIALNSVCALEDQPAGALPELRTGLAELDYRTHGLPRGSLIVIAGRPGMGKTALGLTIAQDLTLRQGKAAAFFSLEMAAGEIALRVIAAEAGIPLLSVRTGRLSRRQWQGVHEAVARLSTAPFYLADAGSLTVAALGSACRRLLKSASLDVVLVDYIQLMRGGEPGGYRSEHEELASISRGLKRLARELDIPVIALCQLSRQSERRGAGTRPQLSDLRGSGKIEEDADLVLFPWPATLGGGGPEEADTQLIIAKQRNGPTGEVPVRFEREVVTFRGMETLETAMGVDA